MFDEIEVLLKENNFIIGKKEDITENVLKAIVIENNKRIELFKNTFLPIRIFQNSIVFKDSKVFKYMQTGKMKYYLYILRCK